MGNCGGCDRGGVEIEERPASEGGPYDGKKKTNPPPQRPPIGLLGGRRKSGSWAAALHER